MIAAWRRGNGPARASRRRSTPAATPWLVQPIVVASVLVGLNLFVYASVRHFQLVNWDDSTYVTENPTVLGGLSWSSAWWALTTGHSPYWHPMTWLSHLLDVTLFGTDAGMYHVTNLVLHIANTLARVRALPADDRGARPERVCRGDLRGPSAARGVGRLDRGEEGRAEHVLLAAHRAGLRRLRAAARMAAVSRHAGALCAGPDVETDGGHAAGRVAAARRLAAAAREPRIVDPAGPGEGAAPGARPGDQHRDGDHPAPRRRDGGPRRAAVAGAGGQRHDRLRRVSVEDRLADAPRGVLSALHHRSRSRRRRRGGARRRHAAR